MERKNVAAYFFGNGIYWCDIVTWWIAQLKDLHSSTNADAYTALF
jgi:hypothetical protein